MSYIPTEQYSAHCSASTTDFATYNQCIDEYAAYNEKVMQASMASSDATQQQSDSFHWLTQSAPQSTCVHDENRMFSSYAYGLPRCSTAALPPQHCSVWSCPVPGSSGTTTLSIRSQGQCPNLTTFATDGGQCTAGGYEY